MRAVLQKLHSKRVCLLVDAYFAGDSGIETWQMEGYLYYEYDAIKVVTPVRTYYLNPAYVIAVWELPER